MNKNILSFNGLGFIPGENESKNDYLIRVEELKKFIAEPFRYAELHRVKLDFLKNSFTHVSNPRKDWVNSQLSHLFDISANCIAMIYSSEGLSMFEGAATHMLVIPPYIFPLVQLREIFYKKKKFLIYHEDEILAHEAVHASRVALDSTKYEEIFAYLTSSSYFRKIFGPIIDSSNESMFFVFLVFIMIIFQLSSYFFSFFIINVFYSISLLSVFGLVSFGLFRLFFRRFSFNKALNALNDVTGDSKKSLKILFRLMDKEIDSLAKVKSFLPDQFFDQNNFRHQLIYSCYFKQR